MKLKGGWAEYKQSSLNEVKRNRGIISIILDSTTLHRGYWLPSQQALSTTKTRRKKNFGISKKNSEAGKRRAKAGKNNSIAVITRTIADTKNRITGKLGTVADQRKSEINGIIDK